MPLPAPGSTWPPRDLDPVTSQLRVWSAWYGSDLDELSGLYGGDLSGDPSYGPGIDPLRNDWRARVGRTLARWFWGTRTPDSERRTKLHLPLARDIATTSADLLFGEPPTFQVDGDDRAAQDRLDKLTGLGLRAALTEAAELAAGLGGIYLRIVWDKALRDRPWISAVHADGAIPEWRWDILTAVTFWREVAVDGSKVTRHLERHEPGHIFHGLYEGSRTDLGKLVPLDANPATAGLLEDVPTGLSAGRLTAAYIPNVRPAPGWRRVPAAANLGRADFDGTEPLMDALDETYSSLMRDIRLGRARLHVPDSYLQSLGPGRGALFEDRELYAGVAVPGGGLDAGLLIQETQFAIRVEEHLRTALDLMERIVATSGYSAQTFGLRGEDGGMATATEVAAKQGRSMATRAKKTTYWAPQLAELVLSLLVIDKAVFGTGTTIPDGVDVDFGDGVTETPRQAAETVKMLHDAEAVSVETKVRMVHPDWDKDRVDAEVEAIRADGGMMTDPIERMTDPIRNGPPTRDPDEPPDPFAPPVEA